MFCLINCWYLFFSPVSAQRIPRPQGHKLVAMLIDSAKLQTGDTILLEYYPQKRFEKYVNFANYKVLSIDKGNFYQYLLPDVSYEAVYNNGKTKYKDLFSKKQQGYFLYRIRKEILDDLHSGQSVLVVINDSVAVYSPEVMDKIMGDDYTYSKIPLMYLIFSHIRNTVNNYFTENLSVSRVEKLGDWTAVKFTKLNKEVNK